MSMLETTSQARRESGPASPYRSGFGEEFPKAVYLSILGGLA